MINFKFKEIIKKLIKRFPNFRSIFHFFSHKTHMPLYIVNFLYIMCFLYLLVIKNLFQTISFNQTFIQKLIVSYGYINTKKTIIFSILIGLILILLNGTYMYMATNGISKNKLYNAKIIIIVAMVILGFFTMWYFPKHCAFGLCNYATPEQKDISNYKYFNFIGIGDIQNTHMNSEENIWKFRKNKTNDFINNINELADIFKNKQIERLIFKNQNIQNEVTEIIQHELLGVFSPGDCTQFSSDGTMLYDNSIGFYEYAFSNNTEDNGLLKLPSFEILGNHDYFADDDILKKIFYANTNPSKNMIIRRNKKRKYLYDSDEDGNYALRFGDLNIIFINVWPSYEKLLDGKPEGSLRFVTQNLNRSDNQNRKWILVTHYIKYISVNVSNGDDPDMNKLENTHPDFYNIAKNYLPNCLGFFYGHAHVPKLVHRTNTDGLNFYLMPGPAGFTYEGIQLYETSIQIPVFSYDPETKKIKTFLFTKNDTTTDPNFTVT